MVIIFERKDKISGVLTRLEEIKSVYKNVVQKSKKIHHSNDEAVNGRKILKLSSYILNRGKYCRKHMQVA